MDGNRWKPAEEAAVVELELRDILATLLLGWKKVLAFMLVAAIITCGISLLKGPKQKEVTEKDITESREAIASNKVEEAETLFFQYSAYKEMRKDLHDYYATMTEALNEITEENRVQMRRKYYVSSALENLGSIVSQFALTETEYDALREIFPDEEAGQRIYSRAAISAWANSRITVANLEAETLAPIQYLFTLAVIGNSEEQCKEMISVVDEAFSRQLEEMRRIDPKIEVIFGGDDFNHDMLGYATSVRSSSIASLTTLDTQLSDLNKKVKELPSDEKSYYDLLVKQYEQEYQPEEKVSWKKWTVIGAFLGAVLSVIVILWPYLFDGKIKTAGELETSFGRMILNRVDIQGKKNLFGKWAASLCGVDWTAPEVKEAMLSTDLAILLDKAKLKSLYLLCAEEDAEAKRVAAAVQERLQRKNVAYKVAVGNPLSSTEELETFASAEMGVVFAEVKQSRRKLLRRWGELCSRYGLPLAGTVAVQLCWK